MKICLTDSETSRPIPSPGIRVTVYLPPNLVGLKMSDWTVAKVRVAGVAPRRRVCRKASI